MKLSIERRTSKIKFVIMTPKRRIGHWVDTKIIMPYKFFCFSVFKLELKIDYSMSTQQELV